MYENIHVLNVCVNLWVPHKNILTQKFCQLEITVHGLLIKQIIAMYTLLQKQLKAIRSMQCVTHCNRR